MDHNPNPIEKSLPIGQPVSKPELSSKANLVLALGILSLTCFGFLTGVPAFFYGLSELSQIKQGQSPAAQKTKTVIGIILGVMGTLFSLLFLLGFMSLAAL